MFDSDALAVYIGIVATVAGSIILAIGYGLGKLF